MSARVSQKDIAARLGVHVTTVSLALRGHPRLPPETRERVRRMAREMGYRPDPMLSALMAYRKRMRTPRHQGTLAWLDTRVPENRGGHDYYRAGAGARCEELGWKLEEFRLAETSARHLARVLQARNVQGLLLPPQSRSASYLDFDWTPFSAVSFDYNLAPRLHLVVDAQYRSTRRAVREMRARGYERIGFATTEDNELHTDRNFSSGYLAEHREERREAPPLFVFDDRGGAGRRDFPGRLSQWIGRCRLDAVLALDDEVRGMLDRLGISGKTCGLASMNVLPGAAGLAGICQNDPVIGRTAVDHLVGMIHRGERGLPETPLHLLVDGIWTDGESLPGKAAATAKGRRKPARSVRRR